MRNLFDITSFTTNSLQKPENNAGSTEKIISESIPMAGKL
jgi:hypothetical protein